MKVLKGFLILSGVLLLIIGPTLLYFLYPLFPMATTTYLNCTQCCPSGAPVPTNCCPNDFPATVHAAFDSGGQLPCIDGVSQALFYNSGSGKWEGLITACPSAITVKFSCQDQGGGSYFPYIEITCGGNTAATFGGGSCGPPINFTFPAEIPAPCGPGGSSQPVVVTVTP